MPLICNKCLYTEDHPLGITFDKYGICSGCQIHNEKNTLDWEKRFNKLKKIVGAYKDKSGSKYDCIVPVSGVAENYYTLHIVKNLLGLNPLLVYYNKYFNTPLGIRNLANLRIKFNCDILQQNVNPNIVKKITRSSLNHIGSVYWPILAGQTVFPVQTSVRYNVPLIIWGAHQGIEQTGMFSHEHEVEMTRRYRKDHDLMSFEAYEMVNPFDILSEEDMQQFLYPDDARLNKIGVKGIYLSNYVRWDPKKQNEMMIKKYDYMAASFNRTFDTYDHTDCYVYMDVHDLLKIYKHGYSKVTDHASREIRHGRLTREEAVTTIKHYRFKKIEHLNIFFNWLGITRSGFDFILDQHRNPKFWKQLVNRNWQFKDPLENEMGTDYLVDTNFKKHYPRKYKDKIDNYITIGKGYP